LQADREAGGEFKEQSGSVLREPQAVCALLNRDRRS
jgi:hypothetical protein